ncbi:MAG: helix-turn-helix domain-containing protein [Syntrophaceae bacterium]
MIEEQRDRYLPINVVTEILSCKERHIYDLLQEGKLKGIKIGSRAVRISERSLFAFIESNTISPDDIFDPDLQEKPAKQVQVARSKWMDQK